MVDHEKGKGDAGDWKAPTDADVPDVFEEQEPVQFLRIPDSKQPLSDEEPTPPMGQFVQPKFSPVKEISLADVQERLRKDMQKGLDIKREIVKLETEKKEWDDIFEAIETGDDTYIKGLLVREFGNIEFSSLGDLKNRLDAFFSGGRELSMNLNLNDLQNGQHKKKNMALVFRPRVGGAAPFVEITLTNESGLGIRKDQTITRVTDVHDVTPRPQTPPKPKGLFERWFGKK